MAKINPKKSLNERAPKRDQEHDVEGQREVADDELVDF
jgi:hypothetical protein